MNGIARRSHRLTGEEMLMLREVFPLNCEVVFSEEGIEWFPRRSHTGGIVVGYGRDGETLVIKRPGVKYPTTWGACFWVPAAPLERRRALQQCSEIG